MRLKYFFQTLLFAFRRLFLGDRAPLGGIGLPPLVDEIEEFEDRIRSVLPPDWTLERINIRPWYRGKERKPVLFLNQWNRLWSLQTLWPGHEPQNVQIQLYLVIDTTTISPDKEVLGVWKRFTVVAQDPETIVIDGAFFTWSTLPGWPDACLLYTSPSPRDLSTSRMPSSA